LFKLVLGIFGFDGSDCLQVVGDKNMYRLDDKKFTATKPPIPLSSICGFGMSTGVDQVDSG
jgi:hypothetical protein